MTTKPASINPYTQPKSLEDYKRLLRALLYGDYGQGKTTLAAKIACALGEKFAIITTDSCWTTLLDNPEFKGRIIRFPFVSYGKTYNHIVDIAEKYADGDEVQTLIIDTATGVIDISVRALTIAKRSNPYKDQRDPDAAGWTQYALTKNFLMDALTSIRNTNLNIIYNCHVRFPTDEEIKTGKAIKRPSAPEQSFKELAKECNLIGRTYIKNEDYLLQLRGSDDEVAKSQISTIKQRLYKQDDIPQLLSDWAKR